jgi:hypothetical protein
VKRFARRPVSQRLPTSGHRLLWRQPYGGIHCSARVRRGFTASSPVVVRALWGNQSGRLYVGVHRGASIPIGGRDISAEPCSPPFGLRLGVLLDEQFESAVFASYLIDRGGGRWRKRRRVREYCWHLLRRDERTLTWCGLEVSYKDPRQPWSEVLESQACEKCCIARLERESQADTSQGDRRPSSRGTDRSSSRRSSKRPPAGSED